MTPSIHTFKYWTAETGVGKQDMHWHLKYSRLVIVATVLVLMAASAGAIDINSSHSLQYYSNGVLQFEVNQTGYVTLQDTLDMNNQNIENFFTQGVGGGGDECGPGEFVQYIEPDGSYVCGSAAASASNTYVNITGDVMTGMLNMSNNSINNVSYINEFGNTLRIGGILSLQNNQIEGLADPNDPQDAATKNYVDTNDATGTDDQTLSEVLVQGDVANRSINMSSNDIIGLGNLYSDLSGTQKFFSGSGSQSETVTAIGADGTITYESILIGSSNIIDASITADDIAASAINTTHILDGTIQSADIGNQQVGSDQIAFGAVNESLLASSVAGAGLTGGGGSPLAVGEGNGINVAADSISVEEGDGLSFSGSTLQVGAGTALTSNASYIGVDNGVVPFKGQSETVSGDWTFDNNLTVTGDLNILGNITNTDVQQLSVNGSLLPPAEFPATFDVGTSSRSWANGHFDGTLEAATLTQSGNAVLDTTTSFGGDVSGTYNNLQLVASAVGADEIAADSVNTTHILDGTIATIDIADSAVTDDKIAANSINTTQIEADTILAEDIATGAVGRAEIAQDAVGPGELDNASSFTVSGLDLQNNRIQNVVSTSGGDAVNQSYVDDAQAAATQNLQEVLSEGNQTGGQDIDMAGGSIRSSGGEICIGDQCT